jgi:uncharacterized membrane protein YkvA (DUF1232 family)
MAEKRKNSTSSNVPPRRGIGFIQTFFEQLRLSWALMTDSRVPLPIKFIPLVAVLYVLSPIDFVPDIFPVLGQLDDLGILMTALTAFNSMAPSDVVAEHLSRLRGEAPVIEKKKRDGNIIIDVKPGRTDRQS